MARNQRPKPRAPRLLPLPATLGAEPNGFAIQTVQDQETLGSLIYLSTATPFNFMDQNNNVSSFLQSLNNQVYTQTMNGAALV